MKLEDRQFHLNIAMECYIPQPEEEEDVIFSEMPYLPLKSERLTEANPKLIVNCQP